MAEVDAMRRRVRLTGAELTAVAALGGEDGDAKRESGRLLAHALAAAGALRDDRPPRWVDELLGVVARPALRIAVEILTTGQLGYRIWATPRVAVTGEPMDDGGTELVAIEPIMIPYAITQRVGLRRRPPPPARAPIRLRASRFAALEQRVAADGDLDQVRQGLGADGVAGDDIDALVSLVRRRRVSWQASALWIDDAGRHSGGPLHVMDSGAAGLWLVRVEDPVAVDPVVVLEVAAAGAVWRRLIGLLPHRQPVAAASGVPA